MPLDNFGRLIDAALTWEDLGDLLKDDLAEIKPVVKKISDKAEEDSDTQEKIKDAAEDTSEGLKKLSGKFDKAIALLSKLVNRDLKQEAKKGLNDLRQAAVFIEKPKEKREKEQTKFGWDMAGITKGLETGLKSITDQLQNAFRRNNQAIPTQHQESANIVPIMNKLIATMASGFSAVVDRLEAVQKETNVNVRDMPYGATPMATSGMLKKIADNVQKGGKISGDTTIKIESDIPLPKFGKENLILITYVETNKRPELSSKPIPVEYRITYKETNKRPELSSKPIPVEYRITYKETKKPDLSYKPISVEYRLTHKESEGDPPGIGYNKSEILKIPGIVSLQLDPESQRILRLLEQEWTLKVKRLQVRVSGDKKGGDDDPPLLPPPPKPPTPPGRDDDRLLPDKTPMPVPLPIPGKKDVDDIGDAMEEAARKTGLLTDHLESAVEKLAETTGIPGS